MSNMNEARAFMALAEDAFIAGDTNAIIALFDDDVVVTFADFPSIRGKEAYRKFLEARLKRQLRYRPRTTVKVCYGNVIGSTWEASWVDAQTGLNMQGLGCEFVTLAKGKVIEFVAAFNVWERFTESHIPII